MKKFLLTILFMFLSLNCYADVITVDSLVSADDVTIEWLNGFKNTVVDALNSFPGENIEGTSITTATLDNNANPEYRWGEAFNEFVYTGLLPPTTSGTLTSITTAGTAYIKEDSTLKMKRVVKDATSNLYTASKDTYVDLSSNGTYTYSAVANGAAAPAVASNSIRLAKVVTNGTEVTSVTDMRVTGVQLSTNEDFQLEGFSLLWTAVDRLSADAGLLYNGGTRVRKATITGLNIGTAADYINGASERGTSKFIYVYVDISGNVKLDDNAPDYADTSANTLGTLRYFKNGTDYWRCLGAVRLNATGSGEIIPFTQAGKKMVFSPAENTTQNADLKIVNAGTDATYTEVTNTLCPAFAKIASFEASTNGAGRTAIRPHDGTIGYERYTPSGEYNSFTDIILGTAQHIDYLSSATSSTIYLKDYTMEIR